MTLLCGISLFVPKTEAIKFSAEGVSVPDGVLRVNDATELGCKYIMWRQETLASVTWSIQYSGVKTDFFVYKPFHKEVKPGMTMLSVDATNSQDKMINLTLNDGQEDEVVICCDVKVLRDDGYGIMTTKQKEKCSAPIRVEEPTRHVSRPVRDFPTTQSCGQLSGFPCHSYLILEETYSGGSRLLGRIVDSVVEAIPNWANPRTADNVLETSLAPVQLLDILGFSGHRVVGVSSKNNKMVWTLEREHVHREL